MAAFLPLFPLQLVAFPFENLNLHVFEPRYLQLINECEESDITFGIPTIMDKKLKSYGTEMQLVEVSKRHPNGRLDIKTKGKRIFKIKKYYKNAVGKLYSGADIEWMDYDLEGDYLLNEELLNNLKDLYQYMNINKSIPELTPDFNTFLIAHYVGFNADQEYKFLTILKEKNRQDYLLNHLIKLIPVVKEMEDLRKRVQMNGHFKNVIGGDFGL